MTYRKRWFGNPTLTLTVALFLATTPVAAQVVINEVDYDQSGTDAAEFVELVNTGLVAENLDSLIDAGATVIRRRDQEIDWDVLADPDGNEFCVFSSH